MDEGKKFDSSNNGHYDKLVGDMYARWVLDCVVEIAHAVSRDFIARPEFYKGADIPDDIASLYSSYGNARDFPDKLQREEMSAPIFGISDGYAPNDGSDKFRALRRPLFDACIAYAERTVNDAASGLRQRVLSSMELFPSYLRNFDGASIRSSYGQIRSVSDLSFAVLRSPGVFHVFGVDRAPGDRWPLDVSDPHGSQLIWAICEKLSVDPAFNEDKFGRLRRVAQEGRQALEAILAEGPTSEDHLDDLVTKVYTWATSLRDYRDAGTLP
jgi:hypothetical protein